MGVKRRDRTRAWGLVPGTLCHASVIRDQVSSSRWPVSRRVGSCGRSGLLSCLQIASMSLSSSVISLKGAVPLRIYTISYEKKPWQPRECFIPHTLSYRSCRYPFSHRIGPLSMIRDSSTSLSHVSPYTMSEQDLCLP